MTLKKLVIGKDGTEALPVEVLAESIKEIAAGVRQLRRGPLNDRALVLLIQHAAPSRNGKQISQREVRDVLAGIDNLEHAYIKLGSKPSAAAKSPHDADVEGSKP